MNSDVEGLVAEGYSMACATCAKLHSHRVLDLPGCAAAEGTCGCVLDGKSLPQYEGPLDLETRCYVCGGEAERQVSVPGQSKRLGVCFPHLRWLAQQRTPHLIGVHGGGVILPEGRLLRKPRPLMDILRKLVG